MTREALALVAKPAVTAEEPNKGSGFDVEAYAASHGLAVIRRKPWQSQPGGEIYELDQCPFDSCHNGGSAALTLLDGHPGFNCQHAGCAGRSISDVLSGSRPGPQAESKPAIRTGGERDLVRSFPSSPRQPRSRTRHHLGTSVFLMKVFSILRKDKTEHQRQSSCRANHRPRRNQRRQRQQLGRLLSWRDNESRPHQWTMPMESLASDPGAIRARLLGEGLPFLTTNVRLRERLTEYLQTAPVERRILAVSRVGWHGPSYVLPDEILGPADRDETLYQGSIDAAHCCRANGTDSKWRERIGEMCSGNSRLILATSCGFAGPLLPMAQCESGGIHFHGASSTGKSTGASGGRLCLRRRRVGWVRPELAGYGERP